MITTIFFDFDGVLTTDSSGSFSTSNYLAKETGGHRERIQSCYQKFFYGRDEEVGKFTQENWDKARKCSDIDVSFETLKYAMGHPPRNESVIKLVHSLRKKYKTGLITDNPKERGDLLRETYAFDELFDSVIISAEVGGMKDGQKIFDIALASVGMKPEQCVFTDNKIKNLKIPTEMGFHTYFFDQEKSGIDGFVRWLKELGVTM